MVAQSVSDSALGSWTLNHAKSTFSGAVPYRRVTRFEVVGDAIKETTYTMSTNKPSVLVEYTARFDGKDYPISNSDSEHGVTETRGRPNGRADRQDSGAGRGDGNPNRFRQRQGVDGYDQRHRDGTEYSSVQVYDRQPTVQVR